MKTLALLATIALTNRQTTRFESASRKPTGMLPGNSSMSVATGRPASGGWYRCLAGTYTFPLEAGGIHANDCSPSKDRSLREVVRATFNFAHKTPPQLSRIAVLFNSRHLTATAANKFRRGKFRIRIASKRIAQSGAFEKR